MAVNLPKLFLPKLTHFGLSVGRTSLRAVEVDQNGQVRAYAEVELLPGVFESGVLVQKEVFRQVLHKILTTGKFSTKYVAVFFSEVYAYSRECRLPVIPKEELYEAVSWRIGELFPFPPEEIYFDWRLIEKSEKEYVLSVVAVQKKILDPLVEELVTVGLRPLSIEPGATALARLLKLKSGESVLLTQINRRGAYVTLVHAGVALFTTVINYTAEDTAETFLGNIAQSIQEVAVYYEQKGKLTPESTSVLLTGELATNEWADAVSRKCVFPVRVLKTQIGNPAFNKAYVAATTKIAPPIDENTINLLPRQRQELYDAQRTTYFYTALLTRVLAVVIVLTVAALASFLAVTMEKQRLEARISQLTAENKLQETDLKSLLLFNANAKNIVSLAPLRSTPRMELATIASMLPDGVTVTGWEYDDSKFLYTLHGVSRSREELLQFKSRLEASDEFTKVTLPLGSLESPQNVNYTLTFISKT